MGEGRGQKVRKKLGTSFMNPPVPINPVDDQVGLFLPLFYLNPSIQIFAWSSSPICTLPQYGQINLDLKKRSKDWSMKGYTMAYINTIEF